MTTEGAPYIPIKVAGTEIRYYPIIQDTLNFLESTWQGIRYEKRLTVKDAKKLISGEMTLEEYKDLKFSSDQSRVGTRQLKDKTKDEIDEGEGSTATSAKRGRISKKQKNKQKDIWRCRWCNSYRMRVVDYGHEKRNLITCANRKCLATANVTNKPVGTQIEAPFNSGYNFGWMMSSKWNMGYPEMDKIESGQLSAIPVIPDLEDDDDESMKEIHCPGQTSLVQIM